MGAPQCCLREVPESGMQITTPMWPLPILDARHPRSKGGQGWVLVETPMEEGSVPFLLSTSGGCQQPVLLLACGHTHASVFTWPPSLCLSSSPSQDSNPIASGTCPNNVIVTGWHLQRPNFQMRSHSQAPRPQPSTTSARHTIFEQVVSTQESQCESNPENCKCPRTLKFSPEI